MIESALIAEARSYALSAHRHEWPPRKGIPSAQHLRETAELVERSGGSELEIAGAWLHDIVEHTPVTIGDIRRRFGDEMAFLVDALTDPSVGRSVPWAERKRHQAEHFAKQCASIKRIKTADQTSRVRSIAAYPPQRALQRRRIRHYIEGACLVALKCIGVSQYLDEQFLEAYEQAKIACA